MIIQLITIGKHMPAWVQDGVQTYLKRLPAQFQLKVTELSMEKRSKNSNIEKLKTLEGQALLSATQPGSLVIALDEHGKTWSTQQLATQLTQWRENYRHIDLLVGGPDGLSDELKRSATLTWSLSPLTLPHPLVRVIIAEQIYRAYSIMTQHPYHRE